MLNSQVLVLNRLWQAVNICSARRAFSLVYTGHAHIVSSDEANTFMIKMAATIGQKIINRIISGKRRNK